MHLQRSMWYVCPALLVLLLLVAQWLVICLLAFLGGYPGGLQMRDPKEERVVIWASQKSI